jgi:hypothetical protein
MHLPYRKLLAGQRQVYLTVDSKVSSALGFSKQVLHMCACLYLRP